MDAVFTLRLYGDGADFRSHFTAVHALLVEVESALSKTCEQSDVWRINTVRTAGDLSPHTEAVLRIALDVMRLTDGAYLPTLGAVTDLWKQAQEDNTLPDSEQMEKDLVAARQGFILEDGVCTILGEGALLDLGGIGKGYAVDCVLRYLEGTEVSGALLSFGSSVATFGEKGNGEPFTVGIRHPRDVDSTVGTLIAPAGVLSVSGDYERYVTVAGERYHHVLDPQTGYPTNSGIASAAVLCESGAYSDAFSTAFLVMGRERAEALLNQGVIKAEAVFVTAEGDCFSLAQSFVKN